MNHTPQIKKAIQFAARKHHGQMRVTKEGDRPLPYITHLFSVALLAAEDGARDEIVIAALLHDTLEDTGTTRDELAHEFGEEVAELVEAVSEPKEKDGEKLDWRGRKGAYLARLEEARAEALLIAVADKIDNIESLLEEHAREGAAFLRHFSQPASSYLRFHGAVLALAERRLPHHPLTIRLAELIEREGETFQ